MQVSPAASLPYDGIQGARRTRDATGETSIQGRRPDQPRGTGTDAARELTPRERQQVAELQQIDRAVRAHEAAHIAAGGEVVTSGANYSYTYGPDGRQYAVGGEVGIDTAPEQDPADNVEKGIAIQDAALAPRDPSAQDYRVAGIGAQLESRGRGELVQERADERADAGTRRRVADAYTASESTAPPSLDTFA
jgi:hypothetical protein